ncbi:hypothetical protein FACS1894214_1950 [Planctomycetales bacterium]|nr:hypothetical protein FACS1894214_1950 [Planctomycetales bacterium]
MKKYCLFAVLAAVLTFGAFYYCVPPQHEAKAWIQILLQKPCFVFKDVGQYSHQTLVETQFSTIRSPMIIEKVLKDPKVANLKCLSRKKDKPDWLVKSIILKAKNNSELATISIKTADAQESAIIVNSIVDAYFGYYEAQMQDWNSKMITQLTLELNRHQAAARFLQEEIRAKMADTAQKSKAEGFVTASMIDVTFQTDQLKRVNNILDLLSTRVMTLQTEMNAPSQVQLRKRATVSDKPERDRQIRIAGTASGTVLLLFLLFGFIIFREKTAVRAGAGTVSCL